MRRTADDIFDLLDYCRYPEALALLNASRLSGYETTILRSLIEIETADPEVAAQNVTTILQRQISARERVLCLFALSRVAYIFGRPNGLALLRQAVSLARGIDDAKLLARAHVRLARFALHRFSVEAAMPELAALRRAAYSAGDAHSLAAFHCYVAEIEMKGGKYEAAFKRLRVANGLSTEAGDDGMCANVNRLFANAAALSSDPHAGLVAIRQSVELLERNGARYSLVAPLTTLAHLDLLVGNLDDAESALKRALQLNFGATSQIACLDALARVDLARRDAEAAAEKIAVIDALGPFSSDEYYWLATVPTRAQWLVESGEAIEALALLRAHKDKVWNTSDHRLAAQYILGEVEALIGLKAYDDAAEQLANAPLSLPTITLEDLVQLNRLAARLSPKHVVNLQARAQRIDSVVFTRDPQEQPAYLPQFGTEAAHSVHESATSVAVCLHPELLAREIAALLVASECADDLEVVRYEKDDGNQSNTSGVVPLVTVETNGVQQFSVVGRPFTGIDSRLTLMSVRLLVRATSELADSRRRERLEPSVWPDSLPEGAADIVIAAESMKELLEIARRVAPSNVTVLITGDTGTGKELLARAVHESSDRRGALFVPFNCSALSRELFDSQLFGHRKGAFTGAHDNFRGVIQTADRGTLFLDEVGELPLDVQPKLLRFLESNEVHPLGESRPFRVDVRVVAATNANLEQLVAEGRFREDLFYRLNVVRLQVPPLRERREEIPLLVHHFADVLMRESRKNGIRIAEETMEYLVLYKWPGNVRQLTNEVRRIIALTDSGGIVMPEHLSHEIRGSRRTVPVTDESIAPTEFVVRMDQPLAAAMRHLERSMVLYALSSAGNRLEDAARMLGLSRKGLYLKRQRLQLQDVQDAGEAKRTTA